MEDKNGENEYYPDYESSGGKNNVEKARDKEAKKNDDNYKEEQEQDKDIEADKKNENKGGKVDEVDYETETGEEAEYQELGQRKDQAKDGEEQGTEGNVKKYYQEG